MKKFISILLALCIMLSSIAFGTASAFAATVNVDKNCTKILLVGNSYTYYNGLDQMLCKLGSVTGKDLLVVSAFKGGVDANVLLTEELTYHAWYKDKRIKTGTGSLENISKLDFGDIKRGNEWDYVYLQNNAEAAATGMGDVYMVGQFTDKLEANTHFIINSNYWVNSLEKDRLAEHYAVAKATGSSLIDTRGFYAQYLNVFKNRVWFKDLTIRDSRNHPSVWGTYIFALSIYAKIYGTKSFPEKADDKNIIPLYNSDTGNVTEIFDTAKFKNSYTLNESLDKETATKLQYLVYKYADYYIGDPIDEESESVKPDDTSAEKADGEGTGGTTADEGTTQDTTPTSKQINTKPSLPSSTIAEVQQYYKENGTAITGWAMLSGYNYYLNSGYITTGGFYNFDGSTYYFNDYGETKNGWFTSSGKTYYAFENGSIAKGWQTSTISDDSGVIRTFYFSSEGELATGQTEIGNRAYFFSKGTDGKQKGVMYKSEWREATDSNGNVTLRYYNKNGVMLTGFNTIKGKKYYFSDSGILQKKQLLTVKNKTYYANKNGVIQRNVFLTIGGKRYFFNSSGVMVKGKLFEYKNHKYYADKYGYIKKGWVKISGKDYYFAKAKTSKFPKYAMYTGTRKIDGKKYKFGKNGICTNKQ